MEKQNKVIFIIDSKKNAEHVNRARELAAVFKEIGWMMKIIDMSSGKKQHEIFYMLQEEQAALVVTYDLAGFSMKTELGNVAYNKLPCRMAHLLFESCESYAEQFNQAFNFSMFFYSAGQEEAALLKSRYRSIENAGGIHPQASGEWRTFINNMLSEMQL